MQTQASCVQPASRTLIGILLLNLRSVLHFDPPFFPGSIFFLSKFPDAVHIDSLISQSYGFHSHVISSAPPMVRLFRIGSHAFQILLGGDDHRGPSISGVGQALHDGLPLEQASALLTDELDHNQRWGAGPPTTAWQTSASQPKTKCQARMRMCLMCCL